MVTFTEEILNGKLHFLCSVYHVEQENFDISCKWLESETELYSMSEIYSKITELLGKIMTVMQNGGLKLS